MIHPHSELRYVSPEIGWGVFATRFIPKGTITWVFDPLDQVLAARDEHLRPAMLQRQLDIYSYENGRGELILCWDHARFVNHSCHPTSLAPGFDLEIAVRDIQAGEQLTDDYGSLNLDEEFDCACGHAECRRKIGPGDFERLSERWDALVAAAFPRLVAVEQPLWELVREQSAIRSVLAGQSGIPSCRVHHSHRARSVGAANGCR